MDDDEFDADVLAGPPPPLPRPVLVVRDCVHVSASGSGLSQIAAILLGHRLPHPAPLGAVWRAVHDMADQPAEPEAGPWLALGPGRLACHRYAWGDQGDWLLSTDRVTAEDAEYDRPGGCRIETSLAAAMNALAAAADQGQPGAVGNVWLARGSSPSAWCLSSEPGVVIDWLESNTALRGNLYRADADRLCT